MTLNEALSEIKTFWPADQPFPFGGADHSVHIARLEQEFGQELPADLVAYVSRVAPSADVYFDTPGNALCIYGIDRLRFRQDGYNYNPVTNTELEDWSDDLFMIADEGADPIFVRLDAPEEGVERFFHGLGEWESGEGLGETIGVFLLCAAAQHHALNHFESDPIIDDDEGFSLAPKAAAWYFPRMEKWAGDFYSEWCSVFDNS